MRHVDEGDAQPAVHLFQLDLHLFAHLQIQRPQRLVEEQDLRLVDDGAGDGHALLLPARKGGNAALFKPFQVDHGEGVFHLFVYLAAGELLHLRVRFAFIVHVGDGHLFQLEPEGDVVVDVVVGEERVPLEHRVDRPLVGRKVGDVFPVEQNFAAGGDVEPRDHAQRRRLAAARGAEKGDELPFADVEADVLHRRRLIEDLGYVDDLDDLFFLA